MILVPSISPSFGFGRDDSLSPCVRAVVCVPGVGVYGRSIAIDEDDDERLVPN